jgi:hypothetical protein
MNQITILAQLILYQIRHASGLGTGHEPTIEPRTGPCTATTTLRPLPSSPVSCFVQPCFLLFLFFSVSFLFVFCAARSPCLLASPPPPTPPPTPTSRSGPRLISSHLGHPRRRRRRSGAVDPRRSDRPRSVRPPPQLPPPSPPPYPISIASEFRLPSRRPRRRRRPQSRRAGLRVRNRALGAEARYPPADEVYTRVPIRFRRVRRWANDTAATGVDWLRTCVTAGGAAGPFGFDWGLHRELDERLLVASWFWHIRCVQSFLILGVIIATRPMACHVQGFFD